MSYLDLQFPSFASILSNIDNEAIRLDSELEKLQLTQAQRHEAQLQKAHETASRLRTALGDFSTPTETITDIIEQVETEKRPLVVSEVSKIQESLEFKATLQDVVDLLHIGEAVSSKLEANKLTDASKEYERAHSILKKLKSVSEPGRSRDISLRALSEFDKTITVPLMTALQDKLAEELSKSQWPKTAPETLEFFETFSNSLRVEDESQAVLESFAELAVPLDLRVKFNFETERETNRADKPEWLLGHFFKMVDPHIHWLTTMLQPVLDERFPDRFALVELCSALLPSYYRVLQSYFEHVKYSPELLNHLMAETIRFDVDLHDRYFYHPATSTEQRWSGLATSLLNFHPEWFDQWLESERQAAVTQYNEIMEASTAWEIDWDSANSFTHPPVSAINVAQLFDSVTDIYRDLQNPSFQLRMLTEIQLELIESYRRLLAERAALYSTVHSSLGRAVGTVSVEDQKRLQGIAGLQYLGKILGASDYMLNFFESRSNELLFFEMADRVGEPSIFELNLQEFESIKERVINDITKCLTTEFQKVMKPYYHQEWKLGPESDGGASPRLSSVSSKVKPFVVFIEKLAGRVENSLIMHKFTTNVAKQIFQHVIQANSFSTAGGHQLLKDIDTLWSDLQLTQNHEAIRLRQAAELLSDNAAQTPVFDEQERAFILKRSQNY